jgi:hypothetical protein
MKTIRDSVVVVAACVLCFSTAYASCYQKTMYQQVPCNCAGAYKATYLPAGPLTTTGYNYQWNLSCYNPVTSQYCHVAEAAGCHSSSPASKAKVSMSRNKLADLIPVCGGSRIAPSNFDLTAKESVC